jgi:hypothetical protein
MDSSGYILRWLDAQVGRASARLPRVLLLDETKNEVTVVGKPEVLQVGPISNGKSAFRQQYNSHG